MLNMFDAVITLSHLSENPVTDAIRERYPELAHIFDRADLVDNMVHESELAEARSIARCQEGVATELTIRLQRMERMIDVLLSMDASKGLREELVILREFAARAATYGELNS